MGGEARSNGNVNSTVVHQNSNSGFFIEVVYEHVIDVAPHFWKIWKWGETEGFTLVVVTTNIRTRGYGEAIKAFEVCYGNCMRHHLVSWPSRLFPFLLVGQNNMPPLAYPVKFSWPFTAYPQ